MARRVLAFLDFELDLAGASLTRAGKPVALRPKAMDLLGYLASNAGRLVEHEELLGAIWPDVVVAADAAKFCVREIRASLGDDPRQPRVIETVPRRGYRFIAPVGRLPGGGSDAFVGREAERAALRRLAEAARERPQLGLVVGEPGVGKTALLDWFAADATASGALVLSARWGAAVGGSETFGAFLDMWRRACEGPAGVRVRPVLRRAAPAWLARLPMLVGPGEQRALTREALGAPPERLVREMLQALGELARQSDVALLLDDVHLADGSSLDVVSLALRGREPRGLTLAGAARRAELGGALARLLAEGAARELPLGPLSEAEAAELVGGRLGEGRASLYQRTGGHPLFLVALAEHLAAHPGAGADLPASLRWLLEADLGAEPAEAQRALEAAAVVGDGFDAALVAAAVAADAGPTERLLQERARRGAWIVRAGAEYAFAHDLRRALLAERPGAAERALLHARAAEHLRGRGEAGRAARHFEEAGRTAEAIEQRRAAARRALHEHRITDAISELGRALELAGDDEATTVAVRWDLAFARRVTGTIDTREDLGYIIAAARRRGDRRLEAHALMTMAWDHASFLTDRTEALFREALAVAEAAGDPLLVHDARARLGYWRTAYLRWSDEDARAIAPALADARASAAEDLNRPLGQEAHLQVLRGDYAAALRLAEEAEEVSLRRAEWNVYGTSVLVQSFAHAWLGDLPRAVALLASMCKLLHANGLAAAVAVCEALLAWLRAEAGEAEAALRLAREALARARGVGFEFGIYHAAVAEIGVLLHLGRAEEAQARLAELGPDPVVDSGARMIDRLHETEVALARADWPAAAAACARLEALAAGPGEPTFLALAARARAELALAAGRVDEAARLVEDTLARVAERGLGFAAPRVRATAARVAAAR